MTAKQTIQTVDDLLALLPKLIDDVAQAAPYNGKLKIAVKEITAKFEEYHAARSLLKKDDHFGCYDLEKAFAKEVMAPFRKTCADLSAERAQIMHEPRPNGQAVSRFKIGALLLPPRNDASISHNRRVREFAEVYGATCRKNNAHLEAALLNYCKDDTDLKKLALNQSLENIRVSEAGFAVRFRALENERNALTATNK